MHMVEYEEVKFSLPNPLNSSKYVGITDDVENAWMDIAYLPDQMISTTDFPKLRKPADSLRVTDPASGETGYRVGLEVFHQLHCLNLLRMATYPAYYEKIWWSDTNDKPERVRAHLGTYCRVLPYISYPTYPTTPCHSYLLASHADEETYTDHCIEILRMNLMCLSDINVFTFHSRPGVEGAWPDYESHHVCRNFDKVKQWANEHAMPYEDV